MVEERIVRSTVAHFEVESIVKVEVRGEDRQHIVTVWQGKLAGFDGLASDSLAFDWRNRILLLELSQLVLTDCWWENPRNLRFGTLDGSVGVGRDEFEFVFIVSLGGQILLNDVSLSDFLAD